MQATESKFGIFTPLCDVRNKRAARNEDTQVLLDL